jgi:hypothetical protein
MRNAEAMSRETSLHFAPPRQSTPDGCRRRRLLGLLAASPILILGLSRESKAAAESSCVNLKDMPPGESDVRRDLGFKLVSPDTAKRCGGCAFFTATASECGACQLMNGGAVTAHSVCNSWAAKS